VLHADEQLDNAEEAASRAIDLLPEEGEQLRVYQCHRILGEIYHSKGDTEKAIRHFEVALGNASSFNMEDQLFWIHCSLSKLFSGTGRFDDAHLHIERAKSHTTNDPYYLGHVMELQADFWYGQRIFERAGSEASHAADVYEKLGAAQDLGECRKLLQRIDEQMNNPVVSDESGVDGAGELLEMLPLPACINVPF